MERWIDETWHALQPFSGGRAYANYPRVVTGTAGPSVYLDGLERLTQLKRRYDPDNVFRRNANIAPA